MDAVHFAESTDTIRTASAPTPGRIATTWVDAFNADRPYARLVRGADSPADAAVSARTRTRCRRWDSPRPDPVDVELARAASGEDASDRQAARYIDRDDMVTTVMQTFTKVATVQCARCHDQEFDPVSQRDYYALAGRLRRRGQERPPPSSTPIPIHALRQQLRAALHQVRSTSGTNAPAWLTPGSEGRGAPVESARAAAEALWKPLSRAFSTSGSTLTAGEGGMVVASGFERRRRST
jgi:hypothetical protein